MSRKPLLAVLVIVALVVLGAAAWFVFSGSNAPTAGAVADSATPGETVTAWDKTMGNPKAPLLVIEYASPQCPHCAHFDMDFFPLFKKKYIDSGKVYYVLRVFPLSPADVAAEAIARCLPADNYFSFLDLLWRNQMKWDPEYRVPDVHAGLVEMGRIAGVGADKVDACIADQKIAAKITDVGNEATSKFGINGVPTFVIHGQTVSFTGDWDDFQKTVDEALKKKA